MRDFVNPASVHPPAASYSHHVVLENERLLITSGQIGMRIDGTIPADAHDQLDVAFDNIVANLEASGMGLSDLVKLTIFVVGSMDAERRRSQIAELLGTHRPTMSVIYVVALGTDEMKVEVEAIASQPLQPAS